MPDFAIAFPQAAVFPALVIKVTSDFLAEIRTHHFVYIVHSIAFAE